MRKRKVHNFLTSLRNNQSLFIITISFFLLGLINIHLALLGFLCMVIPFVLLMKTKKKTYCQGYCPRASLYTKMGTFKKINRKTPNFFIKGNMKYFILLYFVFNLFIMIAATTRVYSGMMPPMLMARFMIFFPFPGKLPQLLEFPNIAPWITHLSYRVFSMMLSTTILGILFGLLYKPRSWCTICPINTLSDSYLKKIS